MNPAQRNRGIKKARVKEISIIFNERTSRESKLGSRDIKEFFVISFLD